MRERAKRKISRKEIPETTIVTAKCANCNSVVFMGTINTQIKYRVLHERILDHINFFETEHQINITFSKNGHTRTIDAVYLDTPALTSRITKSN